MLSEANRPARHNIPSSTLEHMPALALESLVIAQTGGPSFDDVFSGCRRRGPRRHAGHHIRTHVRISFTTHCS